MKSKVFQGICSAGFKFSLTVLVVLFWSTALSAKEFTGKVVDSNGLALQYVSVDVLGPRKIFTRTDSNGQFSIDLVSGRYIVRFRYRGTRTEHPLEVEPGSEPQSRTFKLEQ